MRVEFIQRNLYRKLQKALTCIDASSGSVDSSFFHIMVPRGRANPKMGSNFYIKIDGALDMISLLLTKSSLRF